LGVWTIEITPKRFAMDMWTCEVVLGVLSSVCFLSRDVTYNFIRGPRWTDCEIWLYGRAVETAGQEHSVCEMYVFRIWLKHFHSVLVRRLHRTSIIRRVQVVTQLIPILRISRNETLRLFVWLTDGGWTARVPRSIGHDLEPLLSAYVVTCRGNVCTWDVFLTSTFCLRRRLFQGDATSGMSATFTGSKYREQFGCVSEKCESS